MANNISLNIVANAQFQQVYAEVARLKEAMISLQKVSVGGAMPTETVSAIRNAQKAFDDAVLSTRAFQVQHVAMTDTVAKFGKQLEAGRLSLNNYYKIWRESAKGVSAELDALATQQARVNRSIAIADPLRPGYAKLVTDINAVVTAEEKATFYQKALNSALNDGTTKLINFGKNTQWAGRQITVGLTMPMAMFGAAAAKTFKEVDQELVRLQKVYGSGLVQPTSQAISAIRSQVIELGQELSKSLGVSMKETASMAAGLAATGLEGQQLLSSTRDALRLATLGEIDYQAALQATVSLQNVYKLNTQGLSEAINFLNAVENQTSTSLQDLVEAIPRVGPIVAQLGGDFKDTAAMMVAMKEAGVPAAQAANAIKSSMASLLNPTKAAREEFAKYGVNIASLAANSKGNGIEMFKQLQSVLQGLEPLARQQLIEKLFGKYQFSRITALLDNLNRAGSQTQTVFGMMTASTLDLALLADRELSQQAQSASGRFKRMVETIKNDFMPLGEFFLNTFTTIGEGVSKLIGAFSAIGSALGPAADMLKVIFGGGLAGALVAGPILMLVGLFANLAGNLLKGANYMRMFKQGMDNALPSQNKFVAGLRNMRSFYENLDLGMVAARNQMDLMPAEIATNAEAFTVLRKAIFDLTLQFEYLAAAQREAMGVGIASNLVNTGAVIASATAMKGQLKLPGFSEGTIYVPGTGNGDTVAAMLTPGEAVIPKNTAKKYRTLIGAMLDNKIPGYQTGTANVKQLSSASGLVNMHGQAPGQLDLDLLRSNASLFPRTTQAGISAATSASSLSNYVFVAPEQMNMGQMTGRAAAKYFEENSEMASSQLLRSITSSFPEAAKDPAVKRDLHSLVKTMAAELKTRGDQLISEGEFYDIAGRAGQAARTSAESRYTAAGLAAAMDPTTIALYGGEENRGARGQRYSVSKAAQSSLFGSSNPAASYRGKALSRIVSTFAGTSAYLKARLGINSPSEATENEVGLPIAQGVEAGVRKGTPGVVKAAKELAEKTMVAGHQVIQDAIPGIDPSSPDYVGSSPSPTPATGRTPSAGKAGIFSRLRTAVSGLRSGGRLGMGTSLIASMAAPMLINAIPDQVGGKDLTGFKNVAGTTVSYAAMGGMFGPYGAAIGAALGLTVSSVSIFAKSIKDNAQKHTERVRAVFTNSASAIQVFSDATSKSSKDIAAQIKTLSDSDPTKLVAEHLKGMTTESSVVGTLKTFAATQVASGMDPKNVEALIRGMLQYSGQVQYLEAALKRIPPATNSVAKSTEIMVSALERNAGTAEFAGKKFDDLEEGQKNYASGIYATVTAIQSGKISGETLTQTLVGLGNGVKNNTKYFEALAVAAQKAGNVDLSNLIIQAQSLNLSASQFGALNSFAQFGVTMTDILAKMPAGIKNPQKWIDANAGAVAKDLAMDKRQKQLDALNRQYSLQDKIASIDKKYEGKTAVYEKEIKALEKKKKLIDDELEAEKDKTDELKRQQEYTLKDIDLKNKAKLAQASGDYLQAALYRQEGMYQTSEFNAETARLAKQEKSDKLGDKIAALRDKVASIREAGDAEKAKAQDSAAKAERAAAYAAIPTAEEIGLAVANAFKYLGLVKPKQPEAPAPKPKPGTTFDDTGAAGAIPPANPESDPQIHRSVIRTLTGSDKIAIGQKFSYKGQNWKVVKLGTGKYQDYVYVRKFALGGSVFGPGGPNSDMIPAMLSNGEYVVNSSAVSQYGTTFLDAINAKRFPNRSSAFSNFGAVADTKSQQDNGGVINNNYIFNVEAGANFDRAAAEMVIKVIKEKNARNGSGNRVIAGKGII